MSLAPGSRIGPYTGCPLRGREDTDLLRGGQAQTFVVSPDGRRLALVDDSRLWVRNLDSLTVRALTRTEGASYPFWSPDSAWIGFFADGRLKKISIESGLVQEICPAADHRGGSWGAASTIVFSTSGGRASLSQVSAQGGQPQPITEAKPARADDALRYLYFLPDGTHFLSLHISGDPKVAGVYAGSLGGEAPEKLLDQSNADGLAVYAPPVGNRGSGHLLFARRSVLMAQAFDASNRRLIGDAIPVAEGVGASGNTGHLDVTVSTTGVLAHSRGGNVQSVELVWHDRSGKRLDTLATGEGAATAFFALAPASPPTKFAGRRSRPGGAEKVLLRSERQSSPWDWSRDGRFILYTRLAGEEDLMVLPAEGGTPAPFAEGPRNQSLGQFSPDGRFVAYVSDEGGSNQVFVRPFPTAFSQTSWQVSTKGGAEPRWRADGRELFFRSDDTLMAASVQPNASGGFEHGEIRTLFKGLQTQTNTNRFNYQPSKDGQRFLLAQRAAGAPPPITVVLSWQAGLPPPK